MPRRDYATTPKGIIDGVERVAPNVRVDVGWEEDSYYTWDGEGPDPADEGYVAYTVAVKAAALTEEDEVFEGTNYLGGVYELPGVEDPNVHGYFPQMLQEALQELYQKMTGFAPRASRKAWNPLEEAERSELADEVAEAIKFVTKSMQKIYEREQRRWRRRRRQA